MWHTLPIDATAILTLWKPQFIEKVGSMLFTLRDFFVSDAWENPIPACKDGAREFCQFIDRLSVYASKYAWGQMRTRPENGRFGVKLEGAGKIRVFAICNPILQTLLRPVHDWCMSVLRLLPTDGTYNPPLDRLKGFKKLYSFDLKAAIPFLLLCPRAC